MKQYRDVLDEADRHFAEVMRTQAKQLQCGRGCSGCCHGLFEVSSSDVVLVVEALKAAEPATRARLIARATDIMRETAHPNIREIDEDEKGEFFERTSRTPCPALGDDNACSIYVNRPLLCRTFGLPIRDGSTYIGEICDLNFQTAPKAKLMAAAWDLQNEDPVSPDDQYTMPEAILIAARSLGKLKVES